MELIAASQIRRAQQRVEQARAYAEQITQAVQDVTSGLTQRAAAKRFVPLVVEEVEEESRGPEALYLFEPSAEEILDRLIPRYVETRVFAALLEAAASEHAARRRAMSAATENAEEIITTLTREANQVRQTEITTEIMEIVGAAEALEKVGS